MVSILEEVKPESEHIFRGLAKRINVVKKPKADEVVPIERWAGSVYVPFFKILYFTGARLSEIAGLRSEDILEDRLLIRPTPERTLKSRSSERDIPLHPEIVPICAVLKRADGYVWPQLRGQGGRWAHNLSKPCRLITGVNPHALRHRVATKLREANFNEATVGRLLGHEPSNVTGSYGLVSWSRLVDAIHSL